VLLNPKIDHVEEKRDYVCDTHDVALIQQIFGNTNNAPTVAEGLYSLHTEGARRAAKEVGEKPHQLQAVRWTTFRAFFSPRVLPKEAIVKIQQVTQDCRDGKLSEDQARSKISQIALQDHEGYPLKPGWDR
jgi:hypothetical protein